MIRNLIENIRVVMVETTHPGNIGAAARAMKTMGCNHLYLVKPTVHLNAESIARAAGADDILSKAVICNSLAEALAGCVAAVATTARYRSISHSVFTPREYAPKLSKLLKLGRVALIFGRESSGLSNEELECCNSILQIPANPEFSSLNVASAVQVLCYEFTQYLQADLEENAEPDVDDKEKTRLATTDEMTYFYEHLEHSMIDVGFLNPEYPRKLMRRLKSLFNRIHLDENEVSILRGFLAAIQETATKNKND